MPQRRPLLSSLFAGCLLLIGSPGAIGADKPKETTRAVVCPICGRANQDTSNYPTKASYTLARGASNTLLGWTELIHAPATEAKRGGNVFAGIAKGVGRGVTRTLAGVGEMLTFWTPKVHDRYLHTAHDCPLCMGRK